MDDRSRVTLSIAIVLVGIILAAAASSMISEADTAQAEGTVIDFGTLIEPFDISRYDYLRLPRPDTWGVIVRGDHPLARKETIVREDLFSVPLSMPRREIVQDSITSWLGIERKELNIFSGHTLLNNAALLVEAGLCCAVCVGGALEIRGGDTLCFRPFAPERTTGHVLAWKKNRVFHSAASRFRDYIQETKAVL